MIPDEKSAEGTIVFDRPIAYLGRWIRGVSLAFDNGKLAKWSATENADMIQRDWDGAKGDPGRERLAYLDIGVNPKGRQGFLQDVIAAGNVYVAVGNNDEVGGKNNSDFFLGASLTGATVTVNDRPVVTDGALAQ